ncbi:hypothetical protein AXG93_4542s1460 [Marchantia polymorpha subsp. ruderalis]|uniref:Uncharacterized protein n=2 Tax=Marchantia polymorpha TaxID=3197 RepID=A0A176W2C9_MARPO|nr:hypothetical protein AXG93_4542s1460 [Marchantia polymorpha subsp. ruderalis]
MTMQQQQQRAFCSATRASAVVREFAQQQQRSPCTWILISKRAAGCSKLRIKISENSLEGLRISRCPLPCSALRTGSGSGTESGKAAQTRQEERSVGAVFSKTRIVEREKVKYSASEARRAQSKRGDSGRKKRRGEKKDSGTNSVNERSGDGHWRLFNIDVPFELDPGKDDFSLNGPLMDAIALLLSCRANRLHKSAFTLVRKSLDARKEPKFVYTVDIDVRKFMETETDASSILSILKVVPGKSEYSLSSRAPLDIVARLHDTEAVSSSSNVDERKSLSEIPSIPDNTSSPSAPVRKGGNRAKVVVVGSGPAGLFAALTLVETGVEVTLVERGQPVETRGRDIGALMVRKILDPNSNLCYGEGGAGTWSDGKLTTRIGKNSSSVQTVLATLVRFGAPPHVMVDGKPHIGTDKLVRILQNLRHHLEALGVKIMFGTKMEDLEIQGGRVTGVRVSKVDNTLHTFDLLEADAVVLGVGHSARDVYEKLLGHNVVLTPKPFAVGFRIEHPQELINELQYHRFATEVQKGKGRLPVADYKLAADGISNDGEVIDDNDGHRRGCFSFCMCPGGQVVPTSTTPSELCINGMSFSKRSSKWANAALVVSVDSSDFSTYGCKDGPLAGVAFQRAIEQEAARRGGGDFVAPVQTVTDFLDDRLSENELPSSSYRLGVKSACLHDILPSNLITSLKSALLVFEKQLPGFIDKRALLHGVETRTSAPVRIERDLETFESISLPGLYPIGEGAGHAGGIVSAAVDGMRVGLALSKTYSQNSTLQELVLEA